MDTKSSFPAFMTYAKLNMHIHLCDEIYIFSISKFEVIYILYHVEW